MTLYRFLSISVTAFLVAGCTPHLLTIQDGLQTKIYDAETKKPLENAFTFYRFGDSSVHARSNRNGDILLEPKRRLEFEPLVGDVWTGPPAMELLVCKEGYIPFLVGRRGYYSPPTVYHPDFIDLTKSSLQPTESCTDQQALSSAVERYEEQIRDKIK